MAIKEGRDFSLPSDWLSIFCRIISGGQFSLDQRDAREAGAQEQHGGASVRNGLRRGGESPAWRGSDRITLAAEIPVQFGLIIAVAGNKARAVDEHETGALGHDGRGDQFKGETAGGPERVNRRRRRKAPGRGDGYGGVQCHRGERTARTVNDRIEPGIDCGGRANGTIVIGGLTGETNRTGDRNRLSGLSSKDQDRRCNC